jgi:hypothetical protein
MVSVHEDWECLQIQSPYDVTKHYLKLISSDRDIGIGDLVEIQFTFKSIPIDILLIQY